MEIPVADSQGLVGRNYINAIRFDGYAFGNLRHRHTGGIGEQPGEQALVLGVQMLDQHKRHAGFRRQRLQQAPEGFQASGRCSHPHDGKGLFGRGESHFPWHVRYPV